MKGPLYGIFAGVFLMVLGCFGSNAFADGAFHTLEISGLDGLATVSESELAHQSGRQGLDLLQLNDSDQSALLGNNIIDGITSNGSNTIDGGSFAGAVGFSTSIQNSGNNVIIQDSTLVNIIFNQ